MQNTQQKLRPAHVKQAVSGLLYPASREEIIEYARDNGAPTGVLDILSRLGEGLYGTETSILAEAGLDEEIRPSATRTQKPLQIPRELPQFHEKTALLLVMGRQEMLVFGAHNGLLVQIGSSKVPTPHYSDNEGHFKSRGNREMAGSGAPRELRDDRIINDALKEHAKNLDGIEVDKVDEIYLFVPEHMKSNIGKILPPPFSGKIEMAVAGNFFHAHPLDLLRKIQAGTPDPVRPEKPEARRILDKSKQARGVMKGRP